MANSADPDQLLLQKPTDLDLHGLLRKGMTCLAREGLTYLKSNQRGLTDWDRERSTLSDIYNKYFKQLQLFAKAFQSCIMITPLMLRTLSKIFCRRHFKIFFSYFSKKKVFTFHTKCLLRKQFAWNVKAYFLGKIKKYHQFVVCWISPENGKG